MSNRLARRPHPAGWEARSLGDVVSRVTRRNGNKSENVLTISARDGLVNQEEFFSRRIASTDLSPYFLLERGDFAYNKSYSAGFPVGVIRRLERYPQGVVSPLYICFRPSDPRVSGDYLAHYFQSGLLDDDIAWIAKEGARNHGLLNVGVSDLLAVPIYLPTYAEQIRISQILDTADEAIRSTKRLIAKLERVKQGLLHDLLTRGIDESGHLRDPADSVGTPLGRRPRSWAVVRLEELLEGRPKNGYSPKEVDQWTGTLMLGLGCLTPNGFRPLQLKNAPAHDTGLKRAVLNDGDLLVSRANTRELVGLVGRFREDDTPCTYPDLMMRLQPNERALPDYLEIALRALSTRRQIQAAASGTSGSMAKISSSAVCGLLIGVPEEAEQRRIIGVLEGEASCMDTEERRLAKLRLVKQGLVDDLLAGRVLVGTSA